jgi:hypothetical protein
MGEGAAYAVTVAVLLAIGGIHFATPRSIACRVDRVQFELRDLRTTIELFRLETGDKTACPSVRTLRARGMLRADAIDPWGNPYRIECRGRALRIATDGPDRRPSTDDDRVISSPY